jgi:hypothetical protein
VSRFRLLRHSLPAAPAITYDTSIGASVDTNGFTSLPLNSGGKYIFCGAGGNDANDGLTHATRVATALHASNLVTPGNGDQVLLAEGTTFTESMPWLAFIGGFDATHPTCFRSYDPADPTNTAKYGRGDQRNARPIFTGTSSAVCGGPVSFLAIQGIDYRSDPSVPSTGGLTLNGNNVTGGANYLLIENCIFRYCGFSYSGGLDGVATPISSHLIIRNCSHYGTWTDNSATHTGNIYCQDNSSFTYEDNVNYHAGWRIGASRSDAASSAANGGSGIGGGPTAFNHSIYVQANTNCIVRRNLFMDGCADGGIARGGSIVWQDNVTIRCPSAGGIGAATGQPADWSAQPLGSLATVSGNVIFAGIDTTPSVPSGEGYSIANLASGSRITNNLLAYNTVVATSSNASALLVNGDALSLGQGCTIEFDHNVCFNWSLAGATKQEFFCVAGSAFSCPHTPSTIASTYDNNKWDDSTSGTNTNVSSVTFPNPYTEASLYTAAGVTDYATLISLSTNAPEQHYQRTLKSLAFAGYGMS